MMKSPALSVRHGAFAITTSCLLAVTVGCPSGPVGPTGPSIGLSPTSLAFSGMEMGADPQDQTIQLSNTGIDTLNWSVSDNADWLSVTPTSGSITTGMEADDLTVSVDTAGLTALGSPYTAQITVDAAGATNTPRTVNVTLTLTALMCESLTGSINVDTTLSAACYNVESSISVSQGAQLTIEPGVILIFDQGNEMTIWDDGRLSAVGTASDPIVLRGAEAIRGYWGGLRFYHSNSTENRLEYVTIEHGGGYWDANLYLVGGSSSPARVQVTNCTLSESESYGFYWDANVAIEGFANNLVTSNELGAGYISAAVAGFLDDTSSFVGNDEDIVRVWGAPVETDQTWPAIDANYLFDGSVSVSAMLTIEAGARLVFESGEEMTIWDDGQLVAVGTSDAPIVFTGQEAIRGYWGGLRFYHSNSTANRLDYVTLEYGGGYWGANLYLNGGSDAPARVNVTNCTVSNSETYGFYFDANTIVEEFGGNVVTGNALGAGHLSAAVAGYMDDTTTYTGNDADEVRVWGATVVTDQTWAGIDADYLLDDSVAVSATLSIAPGARLVFGAGEEMTIWADGRLQAVGTETDPIVFTGVEQTPGYWGGLRFYHSNSEDNQLQWVTIEYAGGYWDGNLYLTGASDSPVLLGATDCTFRQSATWGVYMNRYVNVNEDFDAANMFSGNASGDVYREP